MDSIVTTITTLPPELFINIFSHLPQRGIKTVISPLSFVTRSSPSKNALQSLSLSSRSLRDICSPYVFEAITIKSLVRLEEFVENGVSQKFGGYVKRAVLRWDAMGAIVKQDAQVQTKSDGLRLGELLRKALQSMPGLKSITLDFPGAIEALGYSLSDEEVAAGLKDQLLTIAVRNGRYEFSGEVDELFEGLGRVSALKSIILDGTSHTHLSGLTRPQGALQLTENAFGQLVNLEINGISCINDQMVHDIMASTSVHFTALSVKNCKSVTLAGTRRLLIEFGRTLQSLNLEMVKRKSCPDHDHDEDFELHEFGDDEHLCPIIRDYCTELKILELYTNKICKEILFPYTTVDKRSGIASGAMTGGLPTPPGSPELAPTRVMDIPTPPVDAISDSESIGEEGTMLPPPLFSFNFGHFVQNFKKREVKLVEKRQKLKRISLRIPYDSSCFGAGSGGPSLQQVHTSLCDGLPAKELLEIGRKAFEDGLVDLVKVTGHWKGGPYLIMDD
ncbi:hypothetical protein H072_843 [Dactylellina haptotyla CBS 200.50]|uniref:Uncharacterized protein n=1 Tax=Dactylellina haptotyla (strain CBS 200.50) TaxID=1284197 RepID=S8AW14_DACHA|nr:hypothetical protein H072_843 [Dactylellina haptotyla CBS 200.50]